MTPVHVGINLGRRYIGMAEKLLKSPQICTAFQHVGGVRVPKNVGMQGQADTTAVLSDYTENGLPRDSSSSAVQENSGRLDPAATTFPAKKQPPGNEVLLQRPQRSSGDRHIALLGVFAEYADKALLQVQRGHIEADKLAYPHPAPVQNLEDRPIPVPRKRRLKRLREQRFGLIR